MAAAESDLTTRRLVTGFGTDLGRQRIMATACRRSPGIAVGVWNNATVAVLFFLRAADQLLIPIVLAVLISYIFEPAVAWLGAHRVPRPVATTVLMMSVLTLIGWGAYSLRDDIGQAVQSLPETARRAREMVVSQAGSGPGASIQQAAAELRGQQPASGTDGNQRAPTTSAGQGGGSSTGATGNAAPPGQERSPQQSSQGVMGQGIVGFVQRGVGSVLALAGHVTVIVFLVFFLLLSGEHVRARIIEVPGPDDDHRRTAAGILDDINAQVQRFLVVRLVTAAIVGALTWAVLA